MMTSIHFFQLPLILI